MTSNIKKILKKIWLSISPTYRQVCGIEEHLYRLENMLLVDVYQTALIMKSQVDITKLPKAIGAIRYAQQINYLALQEVVRICNKYQLRYWLDFGTLLGAVRHRGFIPWDDDVDISMPAPDYQRFLQVATEEFVSSDFSLIYIPSQIPKIAHKRILPNTRESQIEFAYGRTNSNLTFFCDIFPYYFADENLEDERINNTIVTSLKRTRPLADYKKLSDLDKAEQMTREYNNSISSVHDTKKMFLGMETDAAFQPLIVHSEDMFPLKTMVFEDQEFYVPNNPEKHLTHLYGDYMSFPKNEHLHSHISQATAKELDLVRNIIYDK